MKLDFTADPTLPSLGLVVLQSDETIEQEFRQIFGPEQLIYVSRVPCATEVSRDTLQEMAATLPTAAGLFPVAADLATIGYACTSGTAQIGAAKVAGLVREGCDTPHVTDPLTALIAACGALGITRLGFLSPYVADVSKHLITVLADNGISSPVFGSFEEGNETTVAHISPQSTIDAAKALAAQGGVDALFLSCTNLRTLGVIEQLEAETGLPVLSSNLVLAWHMAKLGATTWPAFQRGRLFNEG